MKATILTFPLESATELRMEVQARRTEALETADRALPDAKRVYGHLIEVGSFQHAAMQGNVVGKLTQLKRRAAKQRAIAREAAGRYDGLPDDAA